MSRERFHYSPLTSEEQIFASEHHGIVISYLVKNRLSFDDWYDVVIFRYLLSVKRWFAIPELHKYSFCTIAYNAMRSAVGVERTKQKRRKEKSVFVSLDEPAPSFWSGTSGDCPVLSDTIADIHSDFTWRYDDITLAETSKR